MDKEYVGIRQAPAKGYIECEIGGVADFSYPTNKIGKEISYKNSGKISP